MMPVKHQPDDPGPHNTVICPCCGQLWPEQDGDVEKFLRKNAGNFPPTYLARFLSWPLERLQRFACKAKPPIDLKLKKEPEPRGA